MLSNIVAGDIKKILSADLPWQLLFGKTILVTGAGGFLPSYVVQTFAALNRLKIGPPCHIVAMVRNPERALVRLGNLNGRDDFELLPHDVVHPLAYDGPLHIIIHAASPASPKFYLKDPVGTLATNSAGTSNLLRLAYEKCCEAFLFFSSGEVCGEPPFVPFTEDDYGYLNPATIQACYAEGKRFGESMCVAWCRQYGVSTRVVRPFHAYGPTIDLNDGRVFSDFVSDILAARNLRLKSDGSAARAFCYVSDTISGVFTVLLRGADGTSYNIGNDTAYKTICDLADILVTQAFPERGLQLAFDTDQHSSNIERLPLSRSTPDISRIRKIGWEPTTGIIEGFRRTVASFEEERAGTPLRSVVSSFGTAFVSP